LDEPSRSESSSLADLPTALRIEIPNLKSKFCDCGQVENWRLTFSRGIRCKETRQ
jgi:hypothetical protein